MNEMNVIIRSYFYHVNYFESGSRKKVFCYQIEDRKVVNDSCIVGFFRPDEHVKNIYDNVLILIRFYCQRI